MFYGLKSFYNNLSNRNLWILIIILIITFFYVFYKYFFTINSVNINIKTNVSNYKIYLNNIKYNKEFNCKFKKCSYDNIPPFEYKIVIEKENYKKYESTINLKVINNLDITLIKDIKIEKVKKNEKVKMSREKIISSIKNKDFIKFSDKKNYYKKIYNDNKYVYFKINNKLYFYNLLNNNLIETDFVPKIHYIKKINSNTFWIVSEVWIFLFSKNNNKINYFSLFNDFIKKDEYYIGIINSEDKQRKINFWLNNNNLNLIVLYNTKTKAVSILESYTFKITELYSLGDKIFIKNKQKEKFEINWF